MNDPLPASILLVDDRRENLAALRAILADQPGYHLVEAMSAQDALRELLRHDFAVILLDAFLPGTDGFELAKMIKERERTRDVPLLFLTAAGSEQELIRRAYEVGAVDYLMKPVAPEIVRAKIAVFVELKRKTALLKEQGQKLQQAERRQRQLEMAELRNASERRYRQLADSIPQIVWRALPDGRLEYWNRRFFDYTGSEAEMSNEVADGFLHPEDRERCRVLFETAVRDGEPFQCECRLRRVDGEYRWHLRRAVPERTREGELVSWLGTDTDIDDRKRADDERMELLVRERAARFEAEAAQKRAAELYVEARAAVRLRDDFLTVAAHELRTPLTTLRLQAQHVGRGLDRRSEDSMMLRSVERLCRLVDQLLDVSCIAAGKLELQLERSALRTVVQDVVERLGDEATRNGCTIAVQPDGGPAEAEFDAPRIEQVVANLFANAIKYGRGKPVEVSLNADSRAVRLRVRDHGIGIAVDQHERIFDRFTRAVSVREYGGLGLGLFISRQIVEAHGGVIRVSSVPGEGATFEVELPLLQPRSELRV